MTKSHTTQYLYLKVGAFTAATIVRYIAMWIGPESPWWYVAEVARVTMWVIVGVAVIHWIAALETRIRSLENRTATAAARLASIEGLVTAERRELRDGFIESVTRDIQQLDSGVDTLDSE